MSQVFVSYARSTEVEARQVAEALRALGHEVWRDDQLPAHRAYGDVIAERLRAAKAVVVIWSRDAAKSHWVRAEADQAREAGSLVQMSIDGTVPPMPFNQIQCADLNGWDGDIEAPAWMKVARSVSSLVEGNAPSAEPASGRRRRARHLSICVLPFANMSGDAEQEYFSDGISEDIISDLSKISALSVVARNTAFTFKGKAIDVALVAGQLGVSHVLEGSVRKAGSRVRITAQLIDGTAGDHLWAERYDRDLTDIFAIQDEISKAIVGALRLKLLPVEKKAIEHRGTHSVEAYNLYLMARRYWVSGNEGDIGRDELIVRICQRAVDIDPKYARAWALMALAQTEMQTRHGQALDDGAAAAERALELDPDLAEAHCVKARFFAGQGRHDEAQAEIELALRLDPELWEVNDAAGRLAFRRGRIAEALRYFEKAMGLAENDCHSSGFMVVCHTALGDVDAAHRFARITVARAERVLAQDQSNGAILGHGAYSLACLGDGERAKDWMERALLIDPDNLIMRYNLACALATQLKDTEAALALLPPYFAELSLSQIKHAETDPDMDGLRADPRFKAMIVDAKARLGEARPSAPISNGVH